MSTFFLGSDNNKETPLTEEDALLAQMAGYAVMGADGIGVTLYASEVAVVEDVEPEPEVDAEVSEEEVPEPTDAAVAEADDLNVDIGSVEGTGVDGRVKKSDVTAAAEAKHEEDVVAEEDDVEGDTDEEEDKTDKS
jgi:hypothetical protein